MVFFLIWAVVLRLQFTVKPGQRTPQDAINEFIFIIPKFNPLVDHREPTQSVCVADCYFIVKCTAVLDLPFALPIAIYG